jgi:RNA polymerase sigma-70 factor (ECF subfamily)
LRRRERSIGGAQACPGEIDTIMNPPESPSDVELIRGIAEGGELACRLFYRRWAPRLSRFLSHATGSPESADDLLQETFLRVLRAAPRFESRGSAGAWVYRIAANLAYSHWRQRRRGAWLQPVAPDALEIPTSAADPEQDRLRRTWVRETRQAVQQLPANHRLVFLLKVESGLTYEEIGDVLGCPTGTAKSRLHHAVRKLRAALHGWEDADLGDAQRPLAQPGRDAHGV